MTAAAAVLLSALAGQATTGDQQPYLVIVRGPADACSAEVAGRRFTMDELLESARIEAGKGRSARIIIETSDTPYRCIGGAIYTLQRAGFLRLDGAAGIVTEQNTGDR